MHPMIDTAPEVAAALARGGAVVALESTLVAHGLPWPENLETARAMQAAVRDSGAVPATIALAEGRLLVGLSDDRLEALARGTVEAEKVSRRDLAVVLHRGDWGATTVAATMAIAHMAGIAVFATGGIGGVHRGAAESFDVSADLLELARTPVGVVASGAKSILDLPKTLEVLETQGVPVIGYGTDDFPAFYSRTSGLALQARADSPVEAAGLIATQRALGPGGLLIANPLPAAAALPAAEVGALVAQAHDDAEAARNIRQGADALLVEAPVRFERRPHARRQQGAPGGKRPPSRRDRHGIGQVMTALPAPFTQWFADKGWRPHHHQRALVTAAQAGRSALLIAPTGGGKTLAGFLPSLIQLATQPAGGLHTLYVSPLKALTVDIHRNLTTPIEQMGLAVTCETRTGDTPDSKRKRQRRAPPNMLLTTPESLALLLSYHDAPQVFGSLAAVVVDELHALAGTKRGDLLALGLARLQGLAPGCRRVGLSATVKDPAALIAWLSPDRPRRGRAGRADHRRRGGRAGDRDPDDARAPALVGPHGGPRAGRGLSAHPGGQHGTGLRQHPGPGRDRVPRALAPQRG